MTYDSKTFIPFSFYWFNDQQKQAEAPNNMPTKVITLNTLTTNNFHLPAHQVAVWYMSHFIAFVKL